MSDVLKLEAFAREGTGKGPNRRLRQKGLVPAILYGGGADEKMISLVAKDLRKELQTNTQFFSQIIELNIDGKAERALAREAQLHPVSDEAVHMDFVRISKDSIVAVAIPVQFLGEEVSPGLKRGGTLNIVRREIELLCPADNIPDKIDVDLSKSHIGDSIHISHVSLPEGITPTITDRDFTICTIVGRGPKEETEETEGEEAED